MSHNWAKRENRFSGSSSVQIRIFNGTSVILRSSPIRGYPYHVCRCPSSAVIKQNGRETVFQVFPDFRIRIRSGNRDFHRVVIRRPRRSRRHPKHARGTSGSQNWPGHYSILYIDVVNAHFNLNLLRIFQNPASGPSKIFLIFREIEPNLLIKEILIKRLECN